MLGQEIYKYKASKDSHILQINSKFLEIFMKNSTFKKAISQNIFHKCKILKPILKLQRYIHANIRENEVINLEKLKQLYLKLKPMKHPLCNDN